NWARRKTGDQVGYDQRLPGQLGTHGQDPGRDDADGHVVDDVVFHQTAAYGNDLRIGKKTSGDGGFVDEGIFSRHMQTVTGRDAVLSVPLLFHARRERRKTGLLSARAPRPP